MGFLGGCAHHLEGPSAQATARSSNGTERKARATAVLSGALMLLWLLPKGQVALTFPCLLSRTSQWVYGFFPQEEASSSIPRFPKLVPGMHSFPSQDFLLKWILIAANSIFSEKISGDLCIPLTFPGKYFLLLSESFPLSPKLPGFLCPRE